jgi:hypothetical protein
MGRQEKWKICEHDNTLGEIQIMRPLCILISVKTCEGIVQMIMGGGGGVKGIIRRELLKIVRTVAVSLRSAQWDYTQIHMGGAVWAPPG